MINRTGTIMNTAFFKSSLGNILFEAIRGLENSGIENI